MSSPGFEVVSNLHQLKNIQGWRFQFKEDFEDLPSGFWFWNTARNSCFGPFLTEEEMKKALKDYNSSKETGEDWF